jgi:hypothetical protein
MGEPLDAGTGMVLNENGRIPTQAFKYYESILYAFYGKEIQVDDDDMRSALADALAMLDIAEYLGCTSLISKPIDVALIKHGQTMYQAISAAPVSWLELGLRIKSELIFKEALIHLVGNFAKIKNDPEGIARVNTLPYQVRKLIEHHHEHLVARAKRLESTLVCAYPSGLMIPCDDLPIKREQYAKDVLVWMALCFFRHWLAQQIVSEKGSLALDGGFKLYTEIGRAGEAYMDKSTINQFHTKAPMTKKAINVLENHLLEIKECMKGHVEQSRILRSECQLDTHRSPVGYLTCINVDREDIPWFQKDDYDAPVTGSKRGRRMGGNEIVQQNLASQRRFAQGIDVAFETEEEDDLDPYEEGWSKRGRYE